MVLRVLHIKLSVKLWYKQNATPLSVRGSLDRMCACMYLCACVHVLVSKKISYLVRSETACSEECVSSCSWSEGTAACLLWETCQVWPLLVQQYTPMSLSRIVGSFKSLIMFNIKLLKVMSRFISNLSWTIRFIRNIATRLPSTCNQCESSRDKTLLKGPLFYPQLCAFISRYISKLSLWQSGIKVAVST